VGLFFLLSAEVQLKLIAKVRASLRERELAVRTALGGSWWRLVRQMLAEAIAIAALGTVLGLSLAWFGIHELLVIAPENVPRLNAIQIDVAVLVFSALAGLGTVAAFGVTPALLAAVGLYGVLSTVVRQRTAEIGVRMAVGAPPSRVFGLVVSYGLKLSVAGIAIGVFAALELTQALKTMLVDVKPTDPLTFLAIVVLFVVIASLASWMPARRDLSGSPAVPNLETVLIPEPLWKLT